MRKLDGQWIEELDGKKHMLKAVEGIHCSGCCHNEGDQGCYISGLGCPTDNGETDLVVRDLGPVNEDGLLPCPFCGEYPESFNKGNEYTKKRGSVLKCNKCHYELTVCAIYQTIAWCKEKVLYNWNRRA